MRRDPLGLLCVCLLLAAILSRSNGSPAWAGKYKPLHLFAAITVLYLAITISRQGSTEEEHLDTGTQDTILYKIHYIGESIRAGNFTDHNE